MYYKRDALLSQVVHHIYHHLLVSVCNLSNCCLVPTFAVGSSSQLVSALSKPTGWSVFAAEVNPSALSRSSASVFLRLSVCVSASASVSAPLSLSHDL